ncbi:sigma-54-dependent transcriptional regulator [Leucothrix mucor]|jgi:DNA-binding NtrC family response regulator|uniref:sigma-54-dependent transcriptional regulator n=1 Tax=Leucothrix mucor TaxID=45248 RepID=UPI0003B77621|nr:sigma-54 dependent transcriptional regulator [Leucothrix mucor]
MKSILVLDDEPGILSFLQRGLGHHYGMVETAGDLSQADELIDRCHFDLIISDIRLPDGSGVEWLTKIREQGHQTPVIFMTAYADLQTAIEALRVGAVDFLMKPFRLEQMQTAVDRCLQYEQLRRENYVFRRQLEQEFNGSIMIGECKEILNVCQIIKHVAPMPSTVLIEGESGTGKELAARAVHELSHRKGNFVSINCGAMTAELLESELFGHVKGAFTGAHQAREGLFAFANEGTLFLDEIGEMPMSMQVHLLRVLEEHSIRPVGSNAEIKVNVRVLAATNRNLADEVKKGHFREDLYYRLNVLSLRMPPLRERMGDIQLLGKHFVEQLSIELGVPKQVIDASEVARLSQYRWPGNVRELKNVIERSLLLGVSPSQCIAGFVSVSQPESVVEESESLQLEVVEKQHILKVLDTEDGNKSAAARILGVSRKTLERKLKAWGLFD